MTNEVSARDKREAIVRDAVEQQMALHDDLAIERERSAKYRRERDLEHQRAEHYRGDLAVAATRADHAEQQVAAFRAQFDMMAETMDNLANMFRELRAKADLAPYAPLAGTFGQGQGQDDGQPAPSFLTKAQPAEQLQ